MTYARNDACPCGSGRKYKHCCYLNQETSPPTTDDSGHAGVISQVLTWLGNRHRKAMTTSFNDLMAQVVDPADMKAFDRLDADTKTAIHINLTEFLLAQGSIMVQGSSRRVMDYVLGPEGLTLSPLKRDWLQQLGNLPMRLYDVTHVVPGVQITLCQTLDQAAPAVVVLEQSGSQSLTPGTSLACRVLRAGEHFELSGAVCSYSQLVAPAVAREQATLIQTLADRTDAENIKSLAMLRAWVKQYVAPMPMPQMVDALTGEPMLLVTDHYQVADWAGLSKALKACPDVEGNKKIGWDRLIDCDEGQTRALASMKVGKDKTRIEVFFKTMGQADKGRTWFEAVAKDKVSFLNREVIDPMKSLAGRSTPKVSKKPTSALDAEVLALAVKQVLHRSYANWADEPIPKLGNQTPRQAIKTAAGLERVKGLLRSYEANEMVMAKQQNRSVVAYDFLWDALKMSR